MAGFWESLIDNLSVGADQLRDEPMPEARRKVTHPGTSVGRDLGKVVRGGLDIFKQLPYPLGPPVGPNSIIPAPPGYKEAGMHLPRAGRIAAAKERAAEEYRAANEGRNPPVFDDSWSMPHEKRYPTHDTTQLGMELTKHPGMRLEHGKGVPFSPHGRVPVIEDWRTDEMRENNPLMPPFSGRGGENKATAADRLEMQQKRDRAERLDYQRRLRASPQMPDIRPDVIRPSAHWRGNPDYDTGKLRPADPGFTTAERLRPGLVRPGMPGSATSGLHISAPGTLAPAQARWDEKYGATHEPDGTPITRQNPSTSADVAGYRPPPARGRDRRTLDRMSKREQMGIYGEQLDKDEIFFQHHYGNGKVGKEFQFDREALNQASPSIRARFAHLEHMRKVRAELQTNPQNWEKLHAAGAPERFYRLAYHQKGIVMRDRKKLGRFYVGDPETGRRIHGDTAGGRRLSKIQQLQRNQQNLARSPQAREAVFNAARRKARLAGMPESEAERFLPDVYRNMFAPSEDGGLPRSTAIYGRAGGSTQRGAYLDRIAQGWLDKRERRYGPERDEVTKTPEGDEVQPLLGDWHRDPITGRMPRERMRPHGPSGQTRFSRRDRHHGTPFWNPETDPRIRRAMALSEANEAAGPAAGSAAATEPFAPESLYSLGQGLEANLSAVGKPSAAEEAAAKAEADAASTPAGPATPATPAGPAATELDPMGFGIYSDDGWNEEKAIGLIRANLITDSGSDNGIAQEVISLLKRGGAPQKVIDRILAGAGVDAEGKIIYRR